MDVYSLAFSLSNLGPKKYQKILLGFKTVEKAWSGTKEEYEDLGIGKLTFKKFDEFRKSLDIEKYISELQKEKVLFVSYLDKEYPVELKKLPDPPIGIFCKGNLLLLRHSEFSSESHKIPKQVRDDNIRGVGTTERVLDDSLADSGLVKEIASSITPRNDNNDLLKIAVVGTRKITEYGRNVTESLVSSLVLNNVCIISGLALGVDGMAHRTAVYNHGNTIAVLACGVDCCLPSENYSLYSSILENNGLIISEYPLSQPPNKGTFLARNRIVAAISDGILITEAAEDSGSLVTAEWGFKLKKKVFAVPGPITSRMSDGSLKLLKNGARLVSGAQDIMNQFKDQNAKIKTKLKSQRYKNLSKEERKIVSLLENEEMTIDELAKATKFPVSKLFISISGLELRGIVKNKAGKICIKDLVEN